MNLNIKKTVAAAAAMLSVLTGAAQDNLSGYFVEDYTYRFLMNPSAGNSANFVAIPALGNFNVGMQGNLKVQDVIYNVNGRTTTFLNPGVSASELMDNLSDKNRTGVNLRVNVLSAGFKAFGGYNTINISARADVNVSLPRSIFSFLKEGISNRTYDISGLRAKGMAYGEISLGHSRNITKEWRVGGNLKFLVGVAGVDADLTKAQLELGRDAWNVTSNATIRTSIKGMKYKMKRNEHTGTDYVSGLDGDFSAPNGFGMAVDLGATYKPKALRDWEFSLAVLDLGFMSWSEDLLATTNGDKRFQSDLYNFNTSDDADNSFSKEWKKMRNSLESLYQLESDGNVGSRTQALNATVNVGAAYTLPVWRKLKFGLVNTTRIAGDFTWTDFRVSANVAPCRVFSAGINGSFGTLGTSFGWLLNLHCPGFNLFLAQDNTFFKLAKPGVPMHSCASASLGMNILF